MTGSTFLCRNHDRVVAIRVHREYLCGAKIDADLAAFAPCREDADFAARSLSHGFCRGWFDGRRHNGHDYPFQMEIEINSFLKRWHDYMELWPPPKLMKIPYFVADCKTISYGDKVYTTRFEMQLIALANWN